MSFNSYSNYSKLLSSYERIELTGGNNSVNSFDDLWTRYFQNQNNSSNPTATAVQSYIPFLSQLANMFIQMIPSGNNTTRDYSADVETQQDVPEETPEETPEEKPEDAVRKILTDANVEVSEETIQLVALKYPTMKAISTAGLTLEERVVNYAKGLKGQQAAQNMAMNSLNEGAEKLEPIQLTEVQEALNAGSQEDFNNAYIQYAQAQIETYDTNNNGKVELNEYLSVEQSNNRENYIESSAKAVFDFLDQNNNDTLDVEEMAALVWATSKINDTNENKTAFDITQEEVAKVNNAFTTIGLNAYMQEANATASNEEMESLKQAILEGTPDKAYLEVMLQNGYQAFKAHLNK